MKNDSLYQKPHALYRRIQLITTLHGLDGRLVIVLTSDPKSANNSLSDQKSAWDASAFELVADLIIAFRQKVIGTACARAIALGMHNALQRRSCAKFKQSMGKFWIFSPKNSIPFLALDLDMRGDVSLVVNKQNFVQFLLSLTLCIPSAMALQGAPKK